MLSKLFYLRGQKAYLYSRRTRILFMDFVFFDDFLFLIASKHNVVNYTIAPSAIQDRGRDILILCDLENLYDNRAVLAGVFGRSRARARAVAQNCRKLRSLFE